MVIHLNDQDVFEGDVVTNGELLADGGLTIGPGGTSVGETAATPASNWPAQTRVQVADTTERAAVVAWRAANAPISATNPLLVWRADGSLTGVNEITLDGVNWYAETPLAGDVEMTIAGTAPYGWLLLQGQTLANASVNYPALWAAADPVFRVGSDLKLPDLRGRSPMGSGTGTGLTLRNLGDLIGAESVVLTEAQLASHYHSINHNHAAANTDTDHTNHSHGVIVGWRKDVMLGGTSSALTRVGGAGDGDIDQSATGQTNQGGNASPDHNHVLDLPGFVGDSGAKGSNQAHPNVQPSTVVNFKVKI